MFRSALLGCSQTILGAFALLGFFIAYAQPSTASMPTLDPKLRLALDATRLLGPQTPPIPAFQWTIEQTRPLKKVRVVQESYVPVGLNGLALTSTKQLTPPLKKEDESASSSLSYSIRGLERVEETDTALSFSAPNLKLPLLNGQNFDLTITYEGQRIVQRCQVGATKVAANFHSTLPGNAISIECKGPAKYLGMSVTVNSTLVYFDALGYFFNEIDDIKSPVGRFVLRKRITDFRLIR